MEASPAAVPEQPKQDWLVYADFFADGRMEFGIAKEPTRENAQDPDTYKNETQVVAAGNPNKIEKRIAIAHGLSGLEALAAKAYAEELAAKAPQGTDSRENVQELIIAEVVRILLGQQPQDPASLFSESNLKPEVMGSLFRARLEVQRSR